MSWNGGQSELGGGSPLMGGKGPEPDYSLFHLYMEVW